MDEKDRENKSPCGNDARMANMSAVSEPRSWCTSSDFSLRLGSATQHPAAKHAKNDGSVYDEGREPTGDTGSSETSL